MSLTNAIRHTFILIILIGFSKTAGGDPNPNPIFHNFQNFRKEFNDIIWNLKNKFEKLKNRIKTTQTAKIGFPKSFLGIEKLKLNLKGFIKGFNSYSKFLIAGFKQKKVEENGLIIMTKWIKLANKTLKKEHRKVFYRFLEACLAFLFNSISVLDNTISVTKTSLRSFPDKLSNLIHSNSKADKVLSENENELIHKTQIMKFWFESSKYNRFSRISLLLNAFKSIWLKQMVDNQMEYLKDAIFCRILVNHTYNQLKDLYFKILKKQSSNNSVDEFGKEGFNVIEKISVMIKIDYIYENDKKQEDQFVLEQNDFMNEIENENDEKLLKKLIKSDLLSFKKSDSDNDEIETELESESEEDASDETDFSDQEFEKEIHEELDSDDLKVDDDYLAGFDDKKNEQETQNQVLLKKIREIFTEDFKQINENLDEIAFKTPEDLKHKVFCNGVLFSNDKQVHAVSENRFEMSHVLTSLYCFQKMFKKSNLKTIVIEIQNAENVVIEKSILTKNDFLHKIKKNGKTVISKYNNHCFFELDFPIKLKLNPMKISLDFLFPWNLKTTIFKPKILFYTQFKKLYEFEKESKWPLNSINELNQERILFIDSSPIDEFVFEIDKEVNFETCKFDEYTPLTDDSLHIFEKYMQTENGGMIFGYEKIEKIIFMHVVGIHQLNFPKVLFKINFA